MECSVATVWMVVRPTLCSIDCYIRSVVRDTRYKLALGHIEGVGLTVLRRLVLAFGSAEAVLSASAKELVAQWSVGPGLASSITKGSAAALAYADEQIEKAERYGVSLLDYAEADYPARLASLPDAPAVLYYKGTDVSSCRKVLSVVGTRRPTEEGRALTESIVGELCRRHGDLLVVSGLAFGIDVAAHRSALHEGAKTIGVVAHGLDMIYPSQHRPVAAQMVTAGGVMTEFAFGTRPEAYNFVSRNRIIAGMADATLCIESGMSGGSLITVRDAFDYDRQVLAVPGFPGREASAGCNDLIKRNIASLVETADDVEAVLGWDVAEKSRKEGGVQASLFAEPQTDEERAIADVLKAENEALSANIIGVRSHLSMDKVNVALLSMEFNGIVQSLPGNNYRLTI